jgi:parallel beta-helix repeat protein
LLSASHATVPPQPGRVPHRGARLYAATPFFAVFAVLLGLIGSAGGSDEASAKGGARACDRVAAPDGSDSGPGTLKHPFRTVQRLADALEPGERGCLRGGVYEAPQRQGVVPPLPCVIPPCQPADPEESGGDPQGTPAHEGYFELRLQTPRITLLSYPQERATVIGRIHVGEGATGSVISDLDLRGQSTGSNTTLVLNARNVTLRRNDITSGATDTCIALTEFHGSRPNGFRILGNRIHDCGQLPATNQEHGIYVSSARDGVIRDNWIYSNADRGVQLYPNADFTQVSQNLITQNGQGVNIGGNDDSTSSGNVIQDNVIADSVLRWNVESFWAGAVGVHNRVRDNCLRASNSQPYYNLNGGISNQAPLGFAVGQNLVAPPPDGASPSEVPIDCG